MFFGGGGAPTYKRCRYAEYCLYLRHLTYVFQSRSTGFYINFLSLKLPIVNWHNVPILYIACVEPRVLTFTYSYFGPSVVISRYIAWRYLGLFDMTLVVLSRLYFIFKIFPGSDLIWFALTLLQLSFIFFTWLSVMLLYAYLPDSAWLYFTMPLLAWFGSDPAYYAAVY